MRAIVCENYGSPNDLEIKNISVPVAGPEQVLLDVESVGLGFFDALSVQGSYQIKQPLPFVPGIEIVGEVMEVGSNVHHLKPGQRVIGFANSGALAEKAVISAVSCFAIPAWLDSVRATCLPISYSTALYGLKDCGAVRSGENVLILGGAGGVALAAVDVARALGARVISAASSEAKRELCRSRGADAVIDYTVDGWRKELVQICGPQGLNVVFDPVGGIYSEPAFRSIAPGGRHLVVGFAANEIPKIPLNLVLLKRASIIGVDWGGYVREDAARAGPLLEQLLEWLKKGLIDPQPGHVYPFDQAGIALTAILSRETIGKVVISIR